MSSPFKKINGILYVKNKMNSMLSAFVDHGLGIDDQGKLCYFVLLTNVRKRFLGGGSDSVPETVQIRIEPFRSTVAMVSRIKDDIKEKIKEALETVEWEDIDEVAADVALSGVGTIVGDSSRLVMTIYVKDDWRKLYYHVPIVLMPEGEIKSLGDFLTELYDKYGDRFFDVLRAFQECTKVGYIPGLVGMRGEILQTILKIDYPRFMRMLEGEVQQEEKEEEAGVPEDYVSLVVEKVRELAAGAGDEDLKQFVQIAIATLVSEEKIPPELAEKEEFLQEVVRALEQEG